jgi:uncharacterized protein YggE
MIDSMSAKSLWAVVILAGLFYLAGQHIASQPERVQREAEAKREITVQGRGEVKVRPDIASLTVGVSTGPQPSAKAAIDLLTTRFNGVVRAVTAEGVADDDITTSNLNLNPAYDYHEGQQVLRGFEAHETILIKIRNLEKIGQIISSTTSQGANQIGNISFTVDDPDELHTHAQALAIQDARQKADVLADELDVGLGEVKSFSAASPTPQQPPILARAALEGSALGGDAQLPVPSGTHDMVVSVTITYSLR